MNKAPLVSVVIPVYNAKHYLAECLDSLLGQTLRETEIIAVDDGSTDESPAILENFAARDPRLKVIRQANAGVSAARNRGMAEARGKYLTFVDADDRLDLQALGYLCFEAERLQTDILLFNYAAVRDGKYQRCTLLDELFNRFADHSLYVRFISYIAHCDSGMDAISFFNFHTVFLQVLLHEISIKMNRHPALTSKQQ